MQPVLFFALMWGCGGGDAEPDSGDTGTTGVTFDLGDPSDGECPKFGSTGAKSFSSGGQERTVNVYYPSGKPEGMPVIFYWHGLGDSGTNAANFIGAEDLAKDLKAIVIVPESLSPLGLTWDVFTGGEDLTLYDDMRICTARDLGADMSRVYSTGFSFGGIWTSYLFMNRGDTLAAVAPLSGGIDASLGLSFTDPVGDSAALIMWGGEGDTFSAMGQSLSFHEGSIAFGDELKAAGHPVIGCNHGGGHTIPFDYRYIWDFLTAHTLGEPSPYDGSAAGLSSDCYVW